MIDWNPEITSSGSMSTEALAEAFAATSRGVDIAGGGGFSWAARTLSPPGVAEFFSARGGIQASGSRRRELTRLQQRRGLLDPLKV